jgi:hypothetical protein
MILGPDMCKLCICEMGQPRQCRAVLCTPPPDCKSFQMGNTCCEFICLGTIYFLYLLILKEMRYQLFNNISFLVRFIDDTLGGNNNSTDFGI